MNKKTIKHFLQGALAVIIFIAGTSTLDFGQTSTECKAKDEKIAAPKYRIADTTRTVSGPPTLVIYLSIKPNSFNQKDMEALARALDRRFCNEQRVSALIFDDRRIFPRTKAVDAIDWSAYRGDFLIDRQTEEGYISFSTERGKPRDEVNIKLEIK